MDLTKIGDTTNQVKEKHYAFSSITLNYANESQELDSNALEAYSAAIDYKKFKENNCSASGKIFVSTVPVDSINNGKSSWFVGAAFIPFWPALPVNEIWNFNFRADIKCNGKLAHKIDFTEHEQVDAFFYGIYRVDLVNEAAKAMHQKLIRRLQEELDPTPQNDFDNG